MQSNPVGGAYRSISEWNEAMVDRYDIERYYERSHFVVRWVERKRIEALRSLANTRPGERVLEVGCGAGHVLQHFKGTRRTGIDLSTAMLARARRRLGDAVTLLQGTAEQLPFQDGSFDVVLCTEVLEHTVDPARVLRELTRVVTPAGRVMVSIPNEATIDRVKRTIRRIPVLRTLLRTLAAEGNEWHLHNFDRAQLDRIAVGTARIETLQGVPNNALAVRYVALLRRNA